MKYKHTLGKSYQEAESNLQLKKYEKKIHCFHTALLISSFFKHINEQD